MNMKVKMSVRTGYLALLIAALACCAPASAELLRFTGAPHFLPAPVMVVGAYAPKDAGVPEGSANFAVFHRGGVLSSGKDGGPVRIAFGINGNAARSWTYQCVKAGGACTVNLPSLKYLAEMDLLGSFSGRPLSGDVTLLEADGGFQDKLKAAGLTAAKGETVNAPMIQEFPISLECELEDEVHIDPEGKARLMVLKVRKVWADEAWIDAKGRICPTSSEGDSLIFFSHSHGSNGGYYGYGQFLGKSEEVSKAYR